MTIRNLSMLLIVCLTLAGCRRLDEAPTPMPTASPTPRSTALPPLPTGVPLGSAENPIQIQLVTSAQDEDLAALASAMEESTGLRFTIAAIERPSEALSALCVSAAGPATIAWMDGLTALAAEAQGCGDATLTIERVVENSLAATQTIHIITDGRREDVAALESASFCRVSATDFETWIYPSILLAANGIDVTRDIGDVSNFADSASAAAAIASQDCDAGAISEATFAALDETVRDDLVRLEPSMDVAYSLLVYPPAIPLNLRNAIDAAFLALAGDADAVPIVRAVLGADAIRQAVRDDLESLRETLEEANLDLAQIGR